MDGALAMAGEVRLGAAKFTGSGMTSDRTRARMVDVLRQRGIKHEKVLSVMSEVPRHVFVEEALQERAYELDKALPIGFGQTISTPEMVAIMSELLCDRPGDVAKQGQ